MAKKNEGTEVVEKVVMRPLADLVRNPKNPRKSDPQGLKDLCESIKRNPAYFNARPILLSDRTGELVIIAGERRSEAAAILEMETVPTILMRGLTEEQEDEIMVRDNTHAGIWDDAKLRILRDKWGGAAFDAWGAEIKQKKMTEILSELSYTPMYYEPQESPLLSLFDCINFDKFNAKINAIEKMNLPKKTKDVLRWFCYRFLKIDFERVADYYYFNATKAEKEAIERLRLVLVDGGVNGFIEDDLLRIAGLATEQEESIEND